MANIIEEKRLDGTGKMKIYTSAKYEKLSERGKTVKIIDPEGRLDGREGLVKIQEPDIELASFDTPKTITTDPIRPRYDFIPPSADKPSSVPLARKTTVFSAK